VALYTLEEFASYVQSDVDTYTATLLRDLVTGLIDAAVGISFDPDAGTTAQKAVALEAAARSYRNPNGISSVTVAIDDYSRTDRWESAALAARVGVYLTAAERAELRGLPRVRSVILQVPS
jgi:hypothetical protein